MSKVKVSTIIPIYKGKKYIDKQIQQIETAAQNLNDRLELIFVNDDPSVPLDDTLHSDIIDIVVLQTDQNRGIQGARVYGLSKASGEYIHFLDQDDEISAYFYSSQLEGIGDADLIYCRCYNGNRESYTWNQVFETVMDREKILEVCPLRSPGQALICKEAIPQVWKDKLISPIGSDDYMLYLSMYAGGCKFTCNQRLLFRHVINGNNYSSDVLNAYVSDQKMIEILLENNVFAPEDIDLARKIPQKNLHRRYMHQCKDQIVLNILSEILRAEASGNAMEDFFLEKGIREVAIYGAGVFGRNIRNILARTDVGSKFFIDRNAQFLHEAIPVYELEDAPDDVDGIIVSLITHEDEVTEMLKEKYSCPIFTIKYIAEQIAPKKNPLI